MFVFSSTLFTQKKHCAQKVGFILCIPAFWYSTSNTHKTPSKLPHFPERKTEVKNHPSSRGACVPYTTPPLLLVCGAMSDEELQKCLRACCSACVVMTMVFYYHLRASSILYCACFVFAPVLV